ncbi:hypothetical protein AB0B21_34670 [Streptomyces rimosus]|uniref:hypothetical protein n=1 Tax=Streptomyces rimosus TaxID=1927 RepID=UPI00067C0C25|nr:hypothetical protein [Streptomyces rimosus]
MGDDTPEHRELHLSPAARPRTALPRRSGDGPVWRGGRCAPERVFALAQAVAARWREQAFHPWLIDNVAAYAESWGPPMLVGLAVQCVGNAHMVELSERQEATKAELLIVLTLPVQRQFFDWPWAQARHAVADRQTVAQTIDRITSEPTAP